MHTTTATMIAKTYIGHTKNGNGQYRIELDRFPFILTTKPNGDVVDDVKNIPENSIIELDWKCNSDRPDYLVRVYSYDGKPI